MNVNGKIDYDKELTKEATIRNFLIVQMEANNSVVRNFRITAFGGKTTTVRNFRIVQIAQNHLFQSDYDRFLQLENQIKQINDDKS